jgi:hypothetical protein
VTRAELALVLERRFFVFRENVYDLPGSRLRPGDDSRDIGVYAEIRVRGFTIRFALLALLGLEALLFLPRPFFLTFEERLTTTIGQ